MRLEGPFSDPGTPWTGRRVFCLASGDSLRRIAAAQWAAIAERQARGDIVLSVNSSIKTARAGGCEPDAIIFTDMNWYEDNEALIRAFPGRLFTFSREARAACDRLERIDNITRPDFSRAPPMRDGRSSGHRAVSLAIMLGAIEIVLLGYDMRVDPQTGRSHCHDDYQHTEQPRAYADEFVPAFRGWNAAALAIGCTVLNATPNSALTEFPAADLDAILGHALAA